MPAATAAPTVFQAQEDLNLLLQSVEQGSAVSLPGLILGIPGVISFGRLQWKGFEVLIVGVDEWRIVSPEHQVRFTRESQEGEDLQEPRGGAAVRSGPDVFVREDQRSDQSRGVLFEHHQ